MKTNKRNFTNHIGMYFLAFILIVATLLSTIAIPQKATENDTGVFGKCKYSNQHNFFYCEKDNYDIIVDNKYYYTDLASFKKLFYEKCKENESAIGGEVSRGDDNFYYSYTGDNYYCVECGKFVKIHSYVLKDDGAYCSVCNHKLNVSANLEYYSAKPDGTKKRPKVLALYDENGNLIDTSKYYVGYDNYCNEPGLHYAKIFDEGKSRSEYLLLDGTISIPYRVDKIDGSELKLKLSKKNYKYTGKNIRPDENDLSLVDANDCEISPYENYKLVYPSESKNVGTYTVTAKFYNDSVLYKGSTSTTYTVYSSDTDGLSLSLSSTKYYYNGKVQKPSVRVLDSKGNAISSSNYNIRYSNANSAALGTYNVTVDFKGNYTGKSITRAYTIAKIPAKKCKVSLSSTSYTYNKKSKKPSVTVKYGKTTLKNKKDYTVSYSKGRKNAGIYFATVKFKGYYEGTTKKSFQIRPNGTKIDKITAGNKKLTIKVKKQSKQISGYQIQYSNKKSFKKNINNPNIKVKKITFGKSKNNSKKRTKTAKNLFGKETYYVRARTYKEVKVDGKKKKVYSKWSKAKKITTKGKKSKKTKYTVLIKNKLLKDNKGNYRICNQSVRDNQRGTGMYYGIPDEPTIMVSDAYSDKEYNDYLKRLYKVYKSINIKSDMSDVQKFTLFLKWTNNKLRYNKDYYNNKAGKDSGTCGYSALKKGKAVCAGYSEIINDLCYLADLPCYILESDSGNHAWNLVKLNGYWYNINTTSSTTYYSWRYVAYGDNLENDNRTVNLDYIAGYLDYERCTSGTFRKTFFNNRCKMATEDTAKKLSKDFYDSIVFAEHYKFKK